MSLTAGYRDATYDIDKDFNKTASWNDGLHDEQRFMPNLPRAIKRSDSTDDIEKLKRHFILARSNQGKFFSWRYFLKVLQDDLRHFDTLVIMSKVMIKKLATPANSEISTYITASDSEPKKGISERNKSRKISFKGKEIGSEVESTSSMDDLNSSFDSRLSLTPQKNILKRMCTEIRTLARKTCKTVEKISSKSKYCSACGDFIGNVKAHKDCSHPFIEGIEYKKPLTRSMIKDSNIIRTKVFDSPMKTPTGAGELSVEKFTKITFAPSAVSRMKAFTKRNS